MQSTPLRYLRADFDDLEEYAPVKPLDVLAAEIGVPIDRLVKLDANENLYGPLPEIRGAIQHADRHVYPDPGQTATARERRFHTAHATTERIVAAGIENDEPETIGAIDVAQHIGQAHTFDLQPLDVIEFGVDGQQEVFTVDFHAVTGEVDHGHVGFVGQRAEIGKGVALVLQTRIP